MKEKEMHDMSTTPDYASLVAQFNYDPLDAGGVKEAERVSRPRDDKGRFVKRTTAETCGS